MKLFTTEKYLDKFNRTEAFARERQGRTSPTACPCCGGRAVEILFGLNGLERPVRVCLDCGQEIRDSYAFLKNTDEKFVRHSGLYVNRIYRFYERKKVGREGKRIFAVRAK